MFQFVEPNRLGMVRSNTNPIVLPYNQHYILRPETIPIVLPYDQHDILNLQLNYSNGAQSGMVLLIFDGRKFRMYSFHPGEDGFWCRHRLSELLMDGLLTSRPERFANNSQPFQLAIAGCRAFMDYVYYPCSLDNVTGCSDQHFPPLVTLASVPKSHLVTFMYQVPCILFSECLYTWRKSGGSCEKREELKRYLSTDEVWGILKPQVFYRGADFPLFWHGQGYGHLKGCDSAMPKDVTNVTGGDAADIMLKEPFLQPRCRAVALSLKAESLMEQNKSFDLNNNQTEYHLLPWIDARFYITGGMHLPQTESQMKMTKTEFVPSSVVQNYKYQIDLGGIGGTSWTGTLTKLAMPGLLFHHETPAKDWFYDEIKPWVHYVPVDLLLSNLYDMYQWAENHPMQAKAIARQGQEFARMVASDEYWNMTFETKYVQGLGHIVDAYQPFPNETLESILEGYLNAGFNLSFMGVYEK